MRASQLRHHFGIALPGVTPSLQCSVVVVLAHAVSHGRYANRRRVSAIGGCGDAEAITTCAVSGAVMMRMQSIRQRRAVATALQSTEIDAGFLHAHNAHDRGRACGIAGAPVPMSMPLRGCRCARVAIAPAPCGMHDGECTPLQTDALQPMARSCPWSCHDAVGQTVTPRAADRRAGLYLIIDPQGLKLVEKADARAWPCGGTSWSAAMPHWPARCRPRSASPERSARESCLSAQETTVPARGPLLRRRRDPAWHRGC